MFMTDVKDDDGSVQKTHFVALFSKKADAIPLMLLHGWPGKADRSRSAVI